MKATDIIAADPQPNDGQPGNGRFVNNWKNTTFPKHDWVTNWVEDLRTPEGTTEDYADCEMCGHSFIRYACHVSHPESGRRLLAGRRCAGRLTGSQGTVDALFRDATRRGRRRDRFEKRTWTPTNDGQMLGLGDATITITQRGGTLEVTCTPRSSKMTTCKGTTDSWKAARALAFDLYEVMKRR